MLTAIVVLMIVNLVLLLVLLWKSGAGSDVQELRADMAERLARSAAETQQQIGDRVGASLAEGRREVSELLAGLQMAQNNRLDSFQSRMDKNLEQIRERTDQRLGEISQQVQQKLDLNIREGFKHFDEVQKSLRAAEEQLVGLNAVGTSITELNNLLKLPHLRGGFGEAALERLLADFLPAAMFELQVSIGGSQERVDAVVKFPDQMLPIDSKFPREQVSALFESADPPAMAEARKSLSRVVREQAKRITKYIRTDAGTTDMALMFLPSETLYFEVLRDTELWQVLTNMRVFPVSPNTLAVTLQSVALAYKYYRVREDMALTLEQVKKAQLHFGRFEKRFEEIGKGLEKAQEAFDTAGTHLRNYSTSVGRLTGEPAEEQLTLPEADAASGSS